MMRNKEQLDLLVKTVVRLAATPEDQRAYLNDLGVSGLTDELALEFDDALQPVRHQLRELGIDPVDIARIELLSDLLVDMSGAENEQLWLPEALDSPPWRRVRDVATELVHLASGATREIADAEGRIDGEDLRDS